MDRVCTTCGRIYGGPHKSKGYPRSIWYGFPVNNGFCPRCRADFNRIGKASPRAAWKFAFDRMSRNYPGGERAPHLRRASLPNPFRSRSEPLRRARKAKAIKRRAQRGKRR